MKRVLTGCWALALALLLAVPARADVIWEPDNSFYARHAEECEHLGRRFHANGAEGFVTLWDAPDGFLVQGQYQNGSTLAVDWVWEDWGCVTVYGNGRETTGWVPLSDLSQVYDYLAFGEEYGDRIAPYDGEFAGYAGGVEEIRFYEYPGAGTVKDTWPTEEILDKLTGRDGEGYIQSVFVDEAGLTWGYVGYLYGSRGLWFCLDDPGGEDFPLRAVTSVELVPAQAPRFPAKACVPYVLAAAAVVLTVILLRHLSRKKREQ